MGARRCSGVDVELETTVHGRRAGGPRCGGGPYKNFDVSRGVLAGQHWPVGMKC